MPAQPDDMFDPPGEAARWPALAANLAECERVLGDPYRAADSAAIQHQRTHRRLTLLAAGCGTLAVLLAVVQLAFHESLKPYSELVGRVEVLAVIAATGAVVLGLVSVRLVKWLVERHKAERLRLAKFGFLIDPVTWSGDAAARGRRVGQLEQLVRRIVGLTPRDVTEETKSDHPPEPPPEREAVRAIDPPTLTQLVEYYRTRRLLYQRDLFRKRVERNEQVDVRTRLLPPVLFFGSVVAALVHFGIELVFHGKGEDVGRWFVFLATALPALAAGVRTFRGAYEFARNHSRYRAKEVALSRLDDIVRGEPDPVSQLRALWYCEEILDFEHREWCRLMMDSEWYG
jgi:hypothetical protein